MPFCWNHLNLWTKDIHLTFHVSLWCLYKPRWSNIIVILENRNPYRNGILLPKLFWSTVRNKIEIWGWRPRICNIFEIITTINSNSERSEQVLLKECIFNLFLEVSHIYWIRTIRIQIGIYRVSQRKHLYFILLWQVEICKVALVWRWFGNSE